MTLHPGFVLEMMIQMCQNVKKLHDKEMIHRDLKLDAFKMNLSSMQISLTDLGSATPIKDAKEIFVGAFINIPPEIVKQTKESDYYGLGMALADFMGWIDETAQNQKIALKLLSNCASSSVAQATGINPNSTKVAGSTGYTSLYAVIKRLTEAMPASRGTIDETITDLTLMQQKIMQR